MITRYNLIQAIYDNVDTWSCQSPCPHRMEEEKPECMCYTCAEQKLKEYENSIRRQMIDEFAQRIANQCMCGSKCRKECSKLDCCLIWDIAEQMKGETDG
ncbi:MAG: hypothetical protein KBT34_10045 [Prevotella sp.]|nr:hypothetical protein [Candidatus Prevotella equi]